jgi:penicillin amidase
VKVIRDRWGIPYIYAENNHDLFVAMGYVHAQDRLWQMECSRRMASGRFAEILGQAVLNTDRLTRAIGLRRIATLEAEQMTTTTRDVIEAYCEGINAFIETNANRLSIEFTLLRVRPEPWTPVDVLTAFKLLSLALSFNRNVELVNANLVTVLGREIYQELGARFPLNHTPQVSEDVDYSAFLEAYEGEPGRRR